MSPPIGQTRGDARDRRWPRRRPVLGHVVDGVGPSVPPGRIVGDARLGDADRDARRGPADDHLRLGRGPDPGRDHPARDLRRGQRRRAAVRLLRLPTGPGRGRRADPLDRGRDGGGDRGRLRRADRDRCRGAAHRDRCRDRPRLERRRGRAGGSRARRSRDDPGWDEQDRDARAAGAVGLGVALRARRRRLLRDQPLRERPDRRHAAPGLVGHACPARRRSSSWRCRSSQPVACGSPASPPRWWSSWPSPRSPARPPTRSGPATASRSPP